MPSPASARTPLPTQASGLHASVAQVPLPGSNGSNTRPEIHSPNAAPRLTASRQGMEQRAGRIEGAYQNESPLALASRDDQHTNLHIVGPAVRNDNQVLTDYLSSIPGGTGDGRMIVPIPATRSRPVLFTVVQKRPVGIGERRSLSADKLEIIEKLLEPRIADVVNEYFSRSNACFPFLDEVSFRKQLYEDKPHISPALLATVYAHALVYWHHSKSLASCRCPDVRYIWNLANEALYSELHLAPGMSTIKAILINIGGRPNTSLIGNGALLGSAVSMAHSLGLNHNPLHWEIPDSEKRLRLKIWWALVVHDRWTSLAHGTPPHITRTHYDVPFPTVESLFRGIASDGQLQTAAVYVALVSLTDVLDQHLQHIYHIQRDTTSAASSLELSLNTWVESLPGEVRHIIIRGNRLDIAGSANLRLAYLTVRLLQQRIDFEAGKQSRSQDDEKLQNCYIQARRTSEEILIMVQELQPQQLGDFWLSITVFTFSATVNFLLRCALETENSPQGLAQSTSFRIARDLVAALQTHKEKHDWDLGDVCLAQHAGIVEKILAGVSQDEQGDSSMVSMQDFVVPDASILDQFFPSIWDTLQNAW